MIRKLRLLLGLLFKQHTLSFKTFYSVDAPKPNVKKIKVVKITEIVRRGKIMWQKITAIRERL